MKTILLTVSFFIIIFTINLFYIGIYDEIYEDIEKNKLWFADGSFTLSLIFLFISIFCSIFIFKSIINKIKKIDLEENYNTTEIYQLELIKHKKNFKINQY